MRLNTCQWLTPGGEADLRGCGGQSVQDEQIEDLRVRESPVLQRLGGESNYVP